MDYITNRKAKFNYELLETYEAGVSLFGFEVKAIRARKGSLEGSRVVVRGGEAFLLGAHIEAYQPKNAPEDYDPSRTRKLLLSKKEIAELAGHEGKKGLTIIPISWYSKNRNIKISVAVARGKKKYDKRETLKKRDEKRDMDRTLKAGY